MADQRSEDSPIGRIDPGGLLDPGQDGLATRLDALGRALVGSELRRVDPPAAYLDAAAERAALARFRSWAPRFAVAALLAIVGGAAVIVSLGVRPPRPPAEPVEAAHGAVPGNEAPTIANLNSANREIVPLGQLRLLGQSGSLVGDGPSPQHAEAYRASDSRRPDRIDAIIQGK